MADESIPRKCWAWVSHASVAYWLWQIAVSAANAIGASYFSWPYLSAHGGWITVYILALIVFAITIWIINGAIWLFRQKRPSKASVTFNYSFALPVIGIQPSLDFSNSMNALEVRPIIRNVAPGPAKAKVENLRIEIEDHFIEWGGSEFIISRDTARTIIPNKGFSLKAYEAFKDISHGKIFCSMVYGHPNDSFTRRTVKKIDLDIFKKHDKEGSPIIVINWFDRGETDDVI